MAGVAYWDSPSTSRPCSKRTSTGIFASLSFARSDASSGLMTPSYSVIRSVPPGVTLTDTFTYTLTDGDNDSDPATVVITLQGQDDPPVITNLTPAALGGEGLVDEDDLLASRGAGGGSRTAGAAVTTGAAGAMAATTWGGVSRAAGAGSGAATLPLSAL